MTFWHQGEPSGTDSTLTLPPSAAAPGLVLRPWTELDIPAMVAAYRDPVMRHCDAAAVTARTRLAGCDLLPALR